MWGNTLVSVTLSNGNIAVNPQRATWGFVVYCCYLVLPLPARHNNQFKQKRVFSSAIRQTINRVLKDSTQGQSRQKQEVGVCTQDKNNVFFVACQLGVKRVYVTLAFLMSSRPGRYKSPYGFGR